MDYIGRHPEIDILGIAADKKLKDVKRFIEKGLQLNDIYHFFFLFFFLWRLFVLHIFEAKFFFFSLFIF